MARGVSQCRPVRSCNTLRVVLSLACTMRLQIQCHGASAALYAECGGSMQGTSPAQGLSCCKGIYFVWCLAQVGYCQGMAFVTGIILMYLPEEPAFQVPRRTLSNAHSLGACIASYVRRTGCSWGYHRSVSVHACDRVQLWLHRA